MIRIYEVVTESGDNRRACTYKVAAKTFDEVVTKVTKKSITPYLSDDYVERIAEVRVLASEG